MSVTISIDDDLAQRLQYQAQVLRLSLDDWAAEILNNGFDLDVNSERWMKSNGRRLALIEKRRQVGLDRAEEAELAALQHLTAKALEPWDRPMLKNLQQHEAVVGITDE